MNYLFPLTFAVLLTVSIPTTPARTARLGEDQQFDSLGRIASRIESYGTFGIFDPEHRDRAVLRVNGFDRKMRYGAPEMECYLANHAKNDLYIYYTVYERKDSEGNAIRTDVVERLVDPKSGDDTRTWLQKEQADSLLLRRHHETLKKLWENYK